MRETVKSQTTVLMVDDDAEMRAMTSKMLELLFDYRVLTAHDGVEGIAAAEEFQPEVILMDLAMAKMDGVVATRILKEREATRHIPIIAYSNYSGVQTWRQMAQNAGCARCIKKQDDPDELHRIITEVLQESKQSQA